jgi:hypothetical protein
MCGNMKKLTCTLLVAVMLVSSCLIFAGSVRASTQTGGTISSETTWTAVPNINLNHPSNVDLGYILQLTPTPTATPVPATDVPATAEPTTTPVPTPSPTPKIMPGSPLSIGDQSFAEAINQFDITALAELVLIVLGVVWVIVILVSVDRNFGRKKEEKQ